jgi:hypothetical protein
MLKISYKHILTHVIMLFLELIKLLWCLASSDANLKQRYSIYMHQKVRAREGNGIKLSRLLDCVWSFTGCFSEYGKWK